MLGILFWCSVFLVFYVYAGYPLAVYILSKAFARPPASSPITPGVTLLFAAHNEEKVIRKKLENSLALEYPRDQLQILVVNDGSVDRTSEIVRSFSSSGVELVDFERRRGKISALKDAIKNVRGEIILFSDADNYYPPNTVSETVKFFFDKTVGAVSGGRNVIGENSLGNAEGLYWKYEEFIKLHETRLGSCVGVAGDLLAIRKPLYMPPPPGIINDDFFTALSVLSQGYRVVYAPSARSFHPVAGSEKEEMERRARMVAGRYQAIFLLWKYLPWKYPLTLWQIVSHKYLRPLVPIFMIMALFAGFLSLFVYRSSEGLGWLLLSPPYNWIFFSAQIVFYALAWSGKKKGLKGLLAKVLYVPSFLVNSNVAALQGLFRYLTSRQTVIWKKASR